MLIRPWVEHGFKWAERNGLVPASAKVSLAAVVERITAGNARQGVDTAEPAPEMRVCLLYTSDAADDDYTV